MANMAQAVRMALHFAEKNYNLKDVFGQDVGAPLGGVFTATQGLKTTWNSTLDERGIIGMAMGIAMAGDRCVATAAQHNAFAHHQRTNGNLAARRRRSGHRQCFVHEGLVRFVG